MSRRAPAAICCAAVRLAAACVITTRSVASPQLVLVSKQGEKEMGGREAQQVGGMWHPTPSRD